MFKLGSLALLLSTVACGSASVTGTVDIVTDSDASPAQDDAGTPDAKTGTKPPTDAGKGATDAATAPDSSPDVDSGDASYAACRATACATVQCGTLATLCNGLPVVCDKCPGNLVGGVGAQVCGDNGHPNICGDQCVNDQLTACGSGGFPFGEAQWGVKAGCNATPYKRDANGNIGAQRGGGIAGCVGWTDHGQQVLCCP